MHETTLFRNSPNVLLLSLHLPEKSQFDTEHSLQELQALSYSLGAVVCASLVQQRDQPHPAFFFGKGKLGQIKDIIHKHSISFLITDGQLSPKQAQNLEKSLHKPVLDRTQLILEIFFQYPFGTLLKPSWTRLGKVLGQKVTIWTPKLDPNYEPMFLGALTCNKKTRIAIELLMDRYWVDFDTIFGPPDA